MVSQRGHSDFGRYVRACLWNGTCSWMNIFLWRLPTTIVGMLASRQPPFELCMAREMSSTLIAMGMKLYEINVLVNQVASSVHDSYVPFEIWNELERFVSIWHFLRSYRAEMTDAQTNQETEEVHVTLTTEPPVGQQQSSSVSLNLVSKFINPSPDTGIDSILNPNVQSYITVNVSVSAPSFDTTIPQPSITIIQSQQQTHDSTTTTTIPITTLPEIPNFAFLFGFERRAW
ncbi:hypothetical protein Tco_0952849 [Tanacetum coccineum]|uniref:Uncharacterized protein n=1 Tax=Tanacetum coccineum TaxID=301880 RepID=A0ABQ5DZ48_9ASTR